MAASEDAATRAFDTHGPALDDMNRDETLDMPTLNEDGSFVFTDEQVLNALGEEPIELNDDFSCVVVVDNLPVISKAKYEKLIKVLRKKSVDKVGAAYIDIYMPFAGDKTKGYAFLEYETQQLAKKAVIELDNFRLDKAHTLRFNMYSDFDKLATVPDKFEAKADDYAAQENTGSWLLDGRMQYLARHGSETEIWWNDPLFSNENGRKLCNNGSVHKDAGKQWTELVCDWSTKGSYMVTFHGPGVALWGGENFSKLGRFAHADVKLIDFSPNENYMVTCNTREAKDPTDPECIIVWDVRTQKKLRGFDGGKQKKWPNFQWSHDDRYIARVGADKTGKSVISVYQVPEMGLLDKKSIKVPGVADILWSPKNNWLAYWVPEKDNVPCKVSIIELPSRKLIREKHLYNVADIKMYWQGNGDYLCVQMSRNKTKKTVVTNLEIFRMRQKNIPIDTLEIEDSVRYFAWEPKGSRFAVVHSDNTRNNVSFYSVYKKQIKKMRTLEDRQVNCLFWSPTGGFIILAGLGSFNGVLECVDVNTMYTLATREHFMCSEVTWDPTGRYVLTSVTQPLLGQSSWKYSTENGYKVWSLDGKGRGLFVNTTTESLDQCYQVLVRPRPEPLMTDAEMKELKKNLKDKYWKRFESEDEKMRVSQMGEKEQRRLELKEQWKAYRAERAREYADEAAHRRELRGGYSSDNDDDYEELEEIVETVLDKTEEVLE